MFGKPFRIKSSTAIRGSDRRKLKQKIKGLFPDLSDDDIEEILPSKEDVNVLKILTHNEQNVTCYVVKRNPNFFEVEGVLFPTVYTLWKYPDLVPSLRTWPPVFQKIRGGADLMLPGVVISEAGLPHFEREEVLSIALVGNRAPIAVGLASLSADEAIQNGMRGKGIRIKHYFMDQLWMIGEQSEPPVFEEILHEKLDDSGISTEEKLTDISVDNGNTQAENIGDLVTLKLTDENISADEDTKNSSNSLNNEEIHPDIPQTDGAFAVKAETCEEVPKTEVELDDSMDSILKNSFLQALLDARKSSLPMLVSTFSGEYLKHACTKRFQLDVKKSSFKKLSKFLNEMKQEGIIDIKQFTKGVDSIAAINFNHEVFMEYKRSQFCSVVKEERTSAADTNISRNAEGPQVEELYAVSAKVVPLFGASRKGIAFSIGEVRSYVTEYVKSENLADSNNKRMVQLDVVLTNILNPDGGGLISFPWDKLMNGILSKMNPCYRITLQGREPVFRKGKLEPIEVKVEQRMGNKKVTLIKNIELFGIDVKEFAQKLQQAAASSTSVSQLPGKNNPGSQVLVQGVQTKHVAALLVAYNIPKKYITGIDKSKGDKKSR